MKRCVEEAAIIVSNDKEPKTSCTITLTSPVMRDTPVAEGGNVTRLSFNIFHLLVCNFVEWSCSIRSIIYKTLIINYRLSNTCFLNIYHVCVNLYCVMAESVGKKHDHSTIIRIKNLILRLLK